MKLILVLSFFILAEVTNAQDANSTSEAITINPFVEGTLLSPSSNQAIPLVIIIADTGPTDRDGNQNFQQHNALKKLAEELSNNTIASFRYDKRIVKQIKKRDVDPNLSFDDFVDDAIATINYFKSKDQFSEIYIIGHGQGSLVGMIAAKENVDGFISISGSGKSIDQVIIDQVNLMDPTLVKSTSEAFSELKNGKITTQYPRALESVFNLQTQPFMMSWMAHNPQEVIKNLTIPTLIINGTKDLQVSIEEAELLKSASLNAQLKLIENMNHVLFIIEGKELENSKSYNESFRPISQDLISELVTFINN